MLKILEDFLYISLHERFRNAFGFQFIPDYDQFTPSILLKIPATILVNLIDFEVIFDFRSFLSPRQF
jgi:hypothetical protein